MKKNYLTKAKVSAVLFTGLIILGEQAQAQTVQTFAYTGSVQTWVVPACVGPATLEVWGAEGGGSALSSNSSSGLGGLGGYARGSLNVVPGSTLYIYVGGYGQSATNGLAAGGFNGGGSGYASSSGEPGNGGGGASDIRIGGQAYTDRVIVAGGGGGGGEDTGDSYGNGGGLTGVGYSAYDATQTSAGGGGGFGFGGDTGFGDGGGGGGGWYGGGTLSSSSIGFDTQGGGGGSGYVGTLTSTLLIDGTSSMPSPTGGTVTGRSGNGFARITYSLSGTAVSISNSTAGVCSGSNVALNGSGVVSYTWLPTGTFAGSNSATVNVSPTSNTTFTLQGTNSNGCVTTATAYVIVNTSAPVLTIANPNNSICLGQTASLTASGAITYTWANPGVVNGQTFAPTATAIYTVAGQNGCGITTAMTNVTVTPLTIPVSANPPTICASQAATLSASGATSYTWMPGSLTGSVPITAPSVTTVYTVTASNGTCLGTNQVTLTAKPNPTLVVLGTSTNICEGQTVSITASGADTYTWFPPAITGSSGTVAPTTPTTYVVYGTNSLGCTSVSFHIVVVKPKPIITGSTPTVLICPGGSATLSAGGAVSYTWSHALSGNPVVVSPQTTTIYSVTGEGTNSCTAVREYTVNVGQPVLTLNTSTSICEGSSVTFTAMNGSNFSWSNGGGTFSTATYTPAMTTVYTASANVSIGSNLSCPTSATVQATVNPNPVVNVTTPGSTVICKADPIVLTANGASSYSWTNGPATAMNTFTSNATITHTLFVTGTNTFGCSSTSLFLVKVIACTGLAEVSMTDPIVVYPNPNNGRFTVKSSQTQTLILFNSLGQAVKRIELNQENRHTAELQDLPVGVYFLFAGERAASRIIVTK
jgi:hypothetical protein